MQKLTSTTFSQFIASGWRVVFIGAAWSETAMGMREIVLRIEGRLASTVSTGELIQNEEAVLTASLTHVVPTVIVFADGKPTGVIPGQLSEPAFLAAIASAGVPLDPASPAQTSSVRPLRFAEMREAALRAAAERATAMPGLVDFFARASDASRVDRNALRAMIVGHSWIAANGTPVELETCVDAALTAIRELPSLLAELETAVLDESNPPVRRLGTLAGLLYGAAPNDGLADELPGSYGYLDDWLVLASTKWTYVRAPAPQQVASLAADAQRVWACLPPALLPHLTHFVGMMAYERLSLEQAPDARVRETLEQQLRQPAPLSFIVPAVQLQAQAANGMRDPMGGWSRNAAGSQWSNGRAMQFHFNGGGSVGMTSSGKIVGGP